jgi:hypothetical protein
MVNMKEDLDIKKNRSSVSSYLDMQPLLGET